MFAPIALLTPLLLSSVTFALTISSGLTARAGAPIPAALHPNGNPERCLIVPGGTLVNGAPVVLGDCTHGDTWAFGHGTTTKVEYNLSGFCLDAGSSPANGVGMKIWQCFDDLPAQTWFFTNDNRMALFNQGQCLDLTGGNMSIGAGVQTWQCTDNDVNQIWTV
ncbi:ricin B lectin domain-containing protein [Crucibulum laeve]|uniref:Ricin B lectin domain-containing protein n=1 Tax=Crucibulum laeve TaxID=68775 RepID=A0A5C3LZL4_9AGAR|nr:ricin B lectin domain-containing protein [Crucibulum laeve]